MAKGKRATNRSTAGTGSACCRDRGIDIPKASPALQRHIARLSQKSKRGSATREEQVELDRLLDARDDLAIR